MRQSKTMFNLGVLTWQYKAKVIYSQAIVQKPPGHTRHSNSTQHIT